VGIRGTAPFILNLDARQRSAANITAQLLYPWEIMLISTEQETDCAPEPDWMFILIIKPTRCTNFSNLFLE